MKKFALTILAFAIAFSYGGGERYKDRMFDVSIKKDVAYASNVKHLNGRLWLCCRCSC